MVVSLSLRNMFREGGYVFRYIVAGLVGNGIVLVFYYFLSFLLHFSVGGSFLISIILAFPISFWLSRSWSFRSNSPLVRSIFFFAALYSISAFLQFLIIFCGIYLGLPHQVAVPFGQLTAAVLFYLAQRFLVFNA